MPSRMISAVIVLFWAATLGWFGYRELWPYWAAHEAPPFVIDLADEATVNNEVLWHIYREPARGAAPEEIGLARTYLRHINDDDTFELSSEMVEVQLLKSVRVPSLVNRYRVTRSGELRSVSAEGKLEVSFLRLPITGQATVSAVVRDGRLVRTAKIKVPALGTIEPKLEDVAAPRGSVLNPLHPVSRIKGLSPGRRWKMPIVDPLADMIGPTINAASKQVTDSGKPLGIKLPESPRELSAEVLRELVKIGYERGEHDCYVIEYRGKDAEPVARTFVRVSDGLVLRQEASSMSERFYLERMSPAEGRMHKHSRKRLFKKP